MKHQKSILKIEPNITCGYDKLISIRLEYKEKLHNTISFQKYAIEMLNNLELDLECYRAKLRELYRSKIRYPEQFSIKMKDQLNRINIKKTEKIEEIKRTVSYIKTKKWEIQVLQSNMRDLSNIIKEIREKYPHYRKEHFRLRHTIYKDHTEKMDAVIVYPIQMVTMPMTSLP